jgi:hypothetical protein
VAEPSSPDQPYRIVSTKQLQGAFLGSLRAPQLTPGQNEVRVKLSGTLSQFPDQSVTCEYLLKGDGTVRVVRECS